MRDELTALEAATVPLEAEWLETDGHGGFASGTVGGRRTRRYHALLLAATPRGRFVLVNGVEVWIVTAQGRVALSSQFYDPGVVHPDGAERIAAFSHDPWPTWTFRLPGGGTVTQEVRALPGGGVVMRWCRPAGTGLEVRPLVSGRDYHALTRQNDAARTENLAGAPGALRLHPHDGVPGLEARAEGGRYEHAPDWYRGFLYEAERERGLDHVEDLLSPGTFVWEDEGEAVLTLRADGDPEGGLDLAGETRRRDAQAASPGGRAALAYVVEGRAGRTVIAGYPWFTDWGRDSFIALRGLLIATGRLEEAAGILSAWAGTVSEGMLPNRFPDGGEPPEFNAVDASLWFVVAVADLVEAAHRARRPVPEAPALWEAACAIVDGHRRGTRYGIRMEEDGLVAAGEPGVQLTWMDAKVGDWVVTPRIGKPVEVQALWIAALRALAPSRPELDALARRARASFEARFWDEGRGHLLDVVDADHEPGRVDPACRPNQILAVGGLPGALLTGERARRVVEAVRSRLLTPHGPRTLAPDEPGYAPRYGGGPLERDGAYHQGTAWPWLMGPFVEAWLRVHPGRRGEAAGFLGALRAHRDGPGFGHVFEVADAEPPHRPGGCPFQAWSLGELIRAERLVAGQDPLDPPPKEVSRR